LEPFATVRGWQNGTVGVEPNTLCRWRTVDRSPTVILLVKRNGPCRTKRGLSMNSLFFGFRQCSSCVVVSAVTTDSSTPSFCWFYGGATLLFSPL
jgi:hypothetical protein